MVKKLGFAGLVAVSSLAFSGCLWNNVDNKYAERTISDQFNVIPSLKELKEPLGKVTTTTCPSDVKLKSNGTFDCDLFFANGWHFKVTMHQGDNNGRILYFSPDEVKQVPKLPDKGDFKLRIEPGEGDRAGIEDEIKTYSLDPFVAAMNTVSPTTKDVAVTFTNSGDVPTYDKANSQISIPYTIAEETYNLMYLAASTEGKGEARTIKKATADTAGVLSFIIAHETAHALLNQFNIPTNGKAESEAAAYALTAKLLNASQDAGPIMLNTLIWGAVSKEVDPSQSPATSAYLMDHTLTTDRGAKVLCYMYGADPAAHASLIADGLLDKQDAESCPDIYAKEAYPWDLKYGPYLNEDNSVG